MENGSWVAGPDGGRPGVTGGEFTATAGVLWQEVHGAAEGFEPLHNGSHWNVTFLAMLLHGRRHGTGADERRGSHTMSMMQSGKLALSSNHPTEKNGGQTSTFTKVPFPTPFPSGSVVIVHATVQTFNGPQTPGVRLHDVNETGFKIRMNEVYSSDTGTADGMHTEEIIGWTAYTV
ncbi:hypothetical protein ABZ508_32855 [Streptomyces lavendulocolor]|uniref:H-type lectin domain-containing protein n=2 Tax=Streptomyces lavendulocolor TaxID=67316 RepID=A0ABV2WFM3_9ACTN